MAIIKKRVGTKAILKMAKPRPLKKARLQRLETAEINPNSRSQINRAKHAVKIAKKTAAKKQAEQFNLHAAPKPTSKRPRKTDESKLALKIIKMRRSQLVKRVGKGQAVRATIAGKIFQAIL